MNQPVKIQNALIFFLFIFTTHLFAQKVETPEFNYTTGKYHKPLSVMISCPTSGAKIYYTTDGSIPDTTATLYTGLPILVAKHASGDTVTNSGDNDPDPEDENEPLTFSSLTIKAFAVKAGMKNSDVATATYVIDLVEATLNIPYADPPPEGGTKHQLDVYRPYGKSNTPVLVFIHGGAWKTGDKNIYMELGNTFAGYYNITTVLANYRLSADPWYAKHPELVQDVALAFRWVYDNIEDYGGDKDRIYMFGQSAGGHLISLFATDTTYLHEVGLHQSDIKKVVSMSGAYDLYDLVAWPSNPLGLNAAEVVMYKTLCLNTFSSYDEDTLDAASPASYVSSEMPPFYLIALNETETFKDMPGFGKEAQNFYEQIQALNGPYVSLERLNESDIPASIAALDFPGGVNGHYQEIYAINTDNWDSRSTKMVASYLEVTPAAPQLVEPEENASGISTTIGLKWQNSENSTYYHLQLGLNSSFDSTNTIFDCYVADTVWTFTDLSPETQYFWRVSGVSAAGESDFSEPRTFTTSTATAISEDSPELPSQMKLTLYPNPFNGVVHLQINIDNPGNRKGKLVIYDILGKTIFSREISITAGQNNFTWQPDDKVPSGIYMVVFKNKTVHLMQKISYVK